MSRYSEIVKDERGYAIPGVSVYVYEWDQPSQTTGALSDLTDDDLTTPLTNPLTTDEFGQFYFNASNGTKLIEYHYAGKLIYREQVILTPAGSYPGNDAALRDDLAAQDGDTLVNFTRPETGAVARTIQDKLRETVSVSDFGAVGDGVANDAAALQSAVNAADRIEFPAGTFKLSTAVALGANAKLVGAGRGVTTIIMSANADMLTINGSGVEIRGVSFLHTGNGRIIYASQDDDMVVEECDLIGNSAGATASLIECSGSFLGLRRNVITNDRTAAGAYALKLDRTSGHLNIESHIQQNRIAGNGRGIWIGSSDNSARPEGINITANSLFCLKENLTIEQLLQANVTANVLDQANDKNIILKPVGPGIQNVEITSNWISTPNQAVTGYGIYHDNTNASSPLDDITILNNSFALCGVGAYLRTPAGPVVLVGNSFTTMGTANLDIADGAAGGPFVIDDNTFDPAKPVTIAATSAAQFIYGSANAGKKLAGWSSTATDTTSKASGSTIQIPHGLAAAPPKSKIITSIVGNVAVFSAASQPIVTAVDATNITVLVTYTAGTPGSYTVNAWASL